MKFFSLSLIFGIIQLIGTLSIVAGETVFQKEDHCLAYQTVKSMFFFVDVEVVGKSCEVTSQVIFSEDHQQFQVVIEVPIRSLDSDNSSRDEHVFEILNAENYSNPT